MTRDLPSALAPGDPCCALAELACSFPLDSGDGAFGTNPVARGIPPAAGGPGPVTRDLREAYRRSVAEERGG